MNLRKLEIILEELNRADRRIRRRQQVWINRQQRAVVCVQRRVRTGASNRQIVVSGRELTLTAIDSNTRVDERVVNRRIDHASIVQTPTTAKRGLAVAGQVNRKADSWSKVVPVVNLSIRLQNVRIDVDWIGIQLVLVAQSKIQRESRRYAPVILNEPVDVGGFHCQTENTESLVEVSCVALAGATTRPNAETVISCWRVGSAGNEGANRTVRLEVDVVDDEIGKAVGARVIEFTTDEAKVVDVV